MAQQIFAIERFINAEYDFIITSPIDPTITSSTLKKAIDKNIKVILISRNINGDNFTTFIAPDNHKIAQKAAHYLLKKLNYKGTILMLQGLEGVTTTNLRESGFEEVAKQYKEIKILKKRGNFLRGDAIKALEEVYKDGVQFDAIYSHSDSMLVGAREVMRKHNALHIPTVGIDYIKSAKEAILDGKQLASFTYPTSAKESIEVIVKLINVQSVPKNITIDSQMIDATNASKIEPIF
ncbi:MAG: substrate-binding domain-containing protein [Sulfurospirillum sp.]|nr:substrate-binding domain-containing protein [Sulfurospirillum sp.]